ncbi:MAG: acetamidase/formamidase family protein [Chloroflexota bacterium]
MLFDTGQPLSAGGGPGHNRWHPDIPPVVSIMPTDTVALSLWDGLDGQIGPSSSVADVESIDLLRTHPMTGPIYVEGAEPGDLLVIDVVSIEPSTFGVTCVIPNKPGSHMGGLFGPRFASPYLVKWRLEEGLARSPDIPGVAIPADPFLGLVGVAPSHERLAVMLRRERELADRGFPVRLPNPEGAIPGTAKDGLRTRPPRETGGNLDVKELTEGARLILPVDVPGALLSVGDPHMAQGDGESCGVAIETSATATLRVGLRKEHEVRWRSRNPVIQFSRAARVPPSRLEYYSTLGFPISPEGKNEYLDLNLAATSAIDEMLGYLTAERGYSDYQAYVLVSVAVDLRISQLLNAPNAIVSAHLPLGIFADA